MKEAYVVLPNNEVAHKERYNRECGGFIHPSVSFGGKVTLGRNVVIEEGTHIGKECFIGHNAVIRPDCILDDYSELRVNGWMANNVRVGHHSVIYNYANLAMGTIVGSYVYFGVRSTTTNAQDIVLHRGREFKCQAPIICSGVRIATAVTILPGITVNQNALVGAGSLVTKDIPGYEMWFGSPAVHRGYVGSQDVPEDWKKHGGG